MSKIKVDEKKFNDIDIYYLRYEYKKKFTDCNEINSVNPLYLRIKDMKGQFKKGKGENGSKNMSFLIKDDEVWDRYDKTWDVIKDKLGVKFHREPVYKYKYLKAKVREFDGVIKTNFLGKGMPKENMYYTCIACITIDSVLRINKKNHPQVYLEECKFEIKKTQMPKFIKNELKSDSDLDSHLEKMEAKIGNELKSDSDNGSGYNTVH